MAHTAKITGATRGVKANGVAHSAYGEYVPSALPGILL